MGNHDVVWMGGAAGSALCIMTVLKTTLTIRWCTTSAA